MRHAIDLTGQRFGRLVVIERAASRGGEARWVCLCDCGTETTVRSGHLRVREGARGTKSCGCLRREPQAEPLEGMRFNRLVAVGRAPNRTSPGGQPRTMWECLCDCGATVVVSAANLKKGTTGSCGCYQRELQRSMLGERRTNWKAVPSYHGAHERVRRRKGKAADQLCVNCAAAAEEWSYTGGCDGEIQGVHRGFTVAYCLHPEHYEPRCKLCHRRYDAERAKTFTE